MRYVRKAALAAGFTLAGALGAAMLDGNLTAAEAVAAAGTALLAGYTTWRVPNDEDPATAPETTGAHAAR